MLGAGWEKKHILLTPDSHVVLLLHGTSQQEKKIGNKKLPTASNTLVDISYVLKSMISTQLNEKNLK